MADVHQLERLTDIAKLMDNAKYSDLIITCEGRRFQVHKSIVCSASFVLAGACDNKMRESDAGVIEHTEYDAETVERIISYIYTQTYTVDRNRQSIASSHGEVSKLETTMPQNVNHDLVAHTRVFAIGEYYNVPQLKLLAIERFEKAAAAEWEVDGFIDVVKEANRLTSSEHRELRDALRRAAMNHITDLTKDDAFVTEIAELEEAQDFAADMLRSVVTHHNEERATLCDQLESTSDALSAAQDRIQQLERALGDEKRNTEWSDQAADRIAKDARDAIEQLQGYVNELPSGCFNSSCSRKFGKLSFEQKGQLGPRGFYSDWRIKCGKCRCRLNK